MTHYRRSPRSMQAALAVLADDLAPQTLLGDVQRVWSEVVGPSIAAEAQPSAERGGVLTSSCSASGWAQELGLMCVAVVGRGTARRSRRERSRGCGASPGVADASLTQRRFSRFCR